MSDFGVHSEVGKLRKVMVHRPDLSLQRLTPTNHDELLFDDVLWVERAQYEHDQFVAQMRERGVEVFLLQRPARRGAGGQRRRLGTRLIELVVSEYTVGLSLVDEVRAAARRPRSPTELATHLIGGLTVAESGLDLGRGAKSSLIGAALDDPSSSCCRRCRTRCSPVTRRAGSTAACRSTRCTGRPAAARRTTSPRSTGRTRCSPTPSSSSGTRRRARRAVRDRATSACRRWRVAT